MSVSHDHTPAFDFEDLGPSALDWTASHRLTSEVIGQDFLIEVAWPLSPVAPGETVPVVYVLDGNSSFAMTAQIARMLQYGPFPLPRTLVVGIGYHDAYSGRRPRPGQLRMRDLMPWTDAAVEALYRNAPAPWTMSPEIRFGGAPAFLDFIETTVKPFVASRYPVDTNDQTLVGMSAGGVFALYTLFTAPAAFRRYVAVSPALYWAGRRLFDLEADLAGRTPDLPAHLFLGVGELEEAHDASQRMVSNLVEMADRLSGRDYPSLDLTTQVFAGETHMSVFPAALSRGLTEVFGGHGDITDWSRALKR